MTLSTNFAAIMRRAPSFIANPAFIDSFATLAPRYDALICDVWGVLHNSITATPGACESLIRYRQHDAQNKVLLLTNAPRPAAEVARQLAQFDIDKRAYDAILTSGDATRHLLIEKAQSGARCHYVGPPKDATLIDNIALDFVAAEAADFALISGLYDDSHETPQDYAAQIDEWRKHNLPLICANPDIIVQRGDEFIYCAGAIAHEYEKVGGKVTYMGKPHPFIYQRARAMLADLNPAISRILAIGDGLATDIRGANQAEIDALFITSGIAQHNDKTLDTPEQLQNLLRHNDAHAIAAMTRLKW